MKPDPAARVRLLPVSPEHCRFHRPKPEPHPETASKCRHGLKGKRYRTAVRYRRWNITTPVAGLYLEGIAAPGMIDGAMDVHLSALFAGQLLGPPLRPGSIARLNHLLTHKVMATRKPLDAAGARLLFPPTCSPGSNPTDRHFARPEHSCARQPRDSLGPLRKPGKMCLKNPVPQAS